MFFSKQKDMTTKDVHGLMNEIGQDLNKYGHKRLREKWRRQDKLNTWLGFFAFLIPIISIALFFVLPALAAAIITVVMIGFILAIILNT